ncbi:MAG: hypothetical protein ACLFPV_03825 [Spirochaetaceae bacterium]
MDKNRPRGGHLSCLVRGAVLVAILAVVATAADAQNAEPVSEEEIERVLKYKETPVMMKTYLNLFMTEENNYDEVGYGASYSTDFFTAAFDFSLINDDKYVPSESYMFGHRFDLKEGRFALEYRPFYFNAGRLVHSDETDTPYSMFISSRELPTVQADFTYDGNFFFYTTRWLLLNQNSEWYRTKVPVYDDDTGVIEENPDELFDEDEAEAAGIAGYVAEPLDRGANYKVYGMKFGDWRVGVQESVVYLYQTFYPEYFFSPLPMYFTQLVNSTKGKPWTQRFDENIHLGAFVDVTRPHYYSYFQFILGDVNLGALVPDQDLTQPWRAGWSIGGSYLFDFGRLGFYHAGATKYLFSATTSDSGSYSKKRYEYTYYPAVEYFYEDRLETLWYYDNYIGYQYGENNLAFMATYENNFADIDVTGMLEYVVSGSKSPANPWHELDRFPEGTKMFNEDQLEHTFRIGSTIRYRYLGWEFGAAAKFGYRINSLELVEVVPDQPKIFRPVGDDEFLYELFLGAKYTFPVHPNPNNHRKDE